MSASTCYAFLDTNVFLHFLPFHQIDWCAQLHEPSVVLVVCAAVLRELEEKHKESRDRKLRERAQKSLSRLRVIRDKGDISLPDGVELTIQAKEPVIDWTTYDLDKDIPDDRIVASALSHEPTRNRVVIITDDFLLQSKAKDLDLEYYVPPDQLRLPHTKTPHEKKTEEKLRRLQEIEQAVPQLSLAFITNEAHEDHKKFTLRKPLPDQDLDREIDEKRKALEYSAPSVKVRGDLGIAGKFFPNPMQKLFEPSQDEIARYHKELEDYLQKDFRDYLERTRHHAHWQARTIQLEFSMVNGGACTADDIDIFLHFRDGLELAEGSNTPAQSEPPKPPSRPRGPLDMKGLTIAPSISSIASSLSHLTGRHPPEAPQMRGPYIEPGESYTVRYWLRRLKQGMEYELGPLWVTFPSVDSAFGFDIDYALVTPDIPGETTGQLHVIVDTG